MKTTILLALSMVMLTANAQQVDYNGLEHADKSDKGKYESYLSKDGYVYKLGDRLRIGKPSSNKTFAFITFGDGALIKVQPLTAASSGQETEIKKIWVVGNKRAGYQVWFRTKGISGLANYSVNIEPAIEAGEIRNMGMTSDEALVELKKAKDKLDLGLITQEEYNTIKANLSKIIK